jgi:predicted transcriptional regulator
MDQTHLSHDQLRRIMAEIVDRGLLHYIEAHRIYITTDKGYIFLKNREYNSWNIWQKSSYSIIDDQLQAV